MKFNQDILQIKIYYFKIICRKYFFKNQNYRKNIKLSKKKQSITQINQYIKLNAEYFRELH